MECNFKNPRRCARAYNKFLDEIKKTEYNLFTNLGNNQTIVMNADYVKIIKSLNGNVTQQLNKD